MKHAILVYEISFYLAPFHTNKFITSRTTLFSFEKNLTLVLTFFKIQFQSKFLFEQPTKLFLIRPRYLPRTKVGNWCETDGRKCKYTRARNEAHLNILRSNIYTVNLISINAFDIFAYFPFVKPTSPPTLNIFPED